MNIPVYNTAGEKIEEKSLPENIKHLNISVPLLHEVVTAYLANQRQGTASTKTRAEVSGGGAKPYRQKGTGRARAGSIRSPLWRHGGVVFGPKPRSYRQDIPKKKRQEALKMSIKSGVLDSNLLILKDIALSDHKTKKIVQILSKLGLNNTKKILFIVKDIDNNLKLATRNLNYLKLVSVSSLNTYDILKSNKIIFTEEAFNEL